MQNLFVEFSFHQVTIRALTCLFHGTEAALQAMHGILRGLLWPETAQLAHIEFEGAWAFTVLLACIC